MLTLRALTQSSRFDQAWALLYNTYPQEITIADNVMAFHCNRAAYRINLTATL